MKHNKIFAFLLAGVLSLGIVGCGSAGSSDSSTQQAASSASGDLKPLRLGCPGFDDYPLLENGKLAYDKGYLEEELNAAGYTLDLVTFKRQVRQSTRHMLPVNWTWHSTGTIRRRQLTATAWIFVLSAWQISR